jgi:hypothetical protein
MNLQQCLKILELETTGSLRDAKRAYKDLVRVWHPDRFQNNPRLKHKAEQKLREINLAYNYFCHHIDSIQAKKLSAPKITSPRSSSGGSPAQPADKSGSNRHATDAPGMAGKSRPEIRHPAAPLTKTASRRSFIGRYVLLAFLVIFAAISALVVYLVYNTEDIASKTRGVASEAMDKILEHLEESQSADKNDSSEKPFIEVLDRTAKSNELQAKFEIHLVSGSIIMTAAWWEEGAMIMYRVDGGSMGIERTRVKKIVKH